MKVYGADICIDCRNYKAIQENRGFEAEYIDIMENTANLKEFLAIRDQDSLYEQVKENHGIGIPLFVRDDGVKTFDVNEAFSWIGQPPVENEEIIEMARVDVGGLTWTREPASYSISNDKIDIVTAPHTDLWQRTYYHFRNDNAPVLQMETDEKFFSFVVKTEFESKHRFDQCGIVMYLDSDNWLKGSIEYENERFQHLGSVVTNNGYSDWATTEIDASVKSMWYRLSRREDDYCIECSDDGVTYRQMRVCHMWNGGGTIKFGIYACSPEDSSFKATFTNMRLMKCIWKAHEGQQPD